LHTSSQVLLALGANLGDRRHYLKLALEQLSQRCGQVIACAPFYETAPIGAADQMFLNSAAIVETSLSPLLMLRTILEIEASLGRNRSQHWGNRTIDIDIVLWRDQQGQNIEISEPSLQIPHPACLERSFVLQPAADIAGDWLHPDTGQTIAAALNGGNFFRKAAVGDWLEIN